MGSFNERAVRAGLSSLAGLGVYWILYKVMGDIPTWMGQVSFAVVLSFMIFNSWRILRGEV